MRRWIVLLVVAMLAMPGAVMAQEATPIPLRTFMPGENLFGNGWVGHTYSGYLSDKEYVESGMLGYFGGPGGDRISIIILRNRTDRASMNAAWELVTGWVQGDTYDSDYKISRERTKALNAKALPTNVADAERIDGTEWFDQNPMCSGAYAVDPDIMVYILALGAITLTAGSNNGANNCDDIASVIATN